MTRLNLSPSPDRVARVCVCVHSGGKLLLVACTESPHGWTLPGGGVNPGESPEAAARREAWEETGATVSIEQELFRLEGEADQPEHWFAARLERLEPSPEGRARLWVEPLHPDWRTDKQIRVLLERSALFGASLIV